MPIFSGQIQSQTQGVDFSDIFKTIVGTTGVANWSFVEEIPAGASAGQSGSAALTVDVFKCAGSGPDANDAGFDWYMYVGKYTYYPDIIYVGFSEDYNPTTKKAYNWPNSNAGYPSPRCTVDANGYAAYSSTISANEVNLYTLLVSAYGATWKTGSLPISGFNYWITISKNHVTFSQQYALIERTFYAGLMDSLVVGVSDPRPFVMLGSHAVGLTKGAFSNLPGVANLEGVANLFGAELSPWNTGGTYTSFILNSQDLWQNSGVVVSRAMVYQPEIGRAHV